MARSSTKSDTAKTKAAPVEEVEVPLKEYRTVTAEERHANDTATPPVEALTDTSVAELAAAAEAAQQKAIDKAAAKAAG